MNASELKGKALAIAAKYPFALPRLDVGVLPLEGQNGELAAAENHLDVEFMQQLRSGAHLDLSVLPA
jgi:hypothetical protein